VKGTRSLFNLASHIRREVTIVLNSVLQRLSILTIGFSVASTSSAFVTQSQQASSRTIVVYLKNVTSRRIYLGCIAEMHVGFAQPQLGEFEI
jgi:hypothetical protein